MNTVIKNEKGVNEKVSIKEDKSAWLYAFFTVAVLAGYGFGTYYFFFVA